MAGSQLTAFMRFCEAETGRTFLSDALFYDFSVTEMQQFWMLFVQWSDLLREGSPHPVCTNDKACEEAAFFPNLRLNYVENLLRINGPEDAARPAVIAHHASRPPDRLSRGELRDHVLAVAANFQHLGVGVGDRVVAVARNNVEAVTAALATAAIGATFSSVAPDLGVVTILDRFEQLAPIALVANLALDDDATSTELSDRVGEVVRRLTSLKAVIALDDGPVPQGLAVPVHRLAQLIEQPTAPETVREFERFPFNHPLFILFSSGTTGRPKCIVHGAGGTLIEHLKEHRLHVDLRPGDTLFFQTTAAWMMWNWQLSALAAGAAIVLYDGPITGPETLWRLVETERVSVFGTSPPYLELCAESGYSPLQRVDPFALRAVLSTGSILHANQYDWLRDHVGSIPVQSISGGTDIIGCFVLGNPNAPVHRGEIQCRSLGLDVRAMSTAATPSGSDVGELVCCNPFPSRPLGFVGDETGQRFHETYFSQHKGVWTHGDLVEISPAGRIRMHGRSDGVLNIHGVRIGPAEIYRVLRGIPEISAAMAVEQQTPDGPDPARLVLLVVLRQPGRLDEALLHIIRHELARGASPLHVPQLVVEVDEASGRDADGRQNLTNGSTATRLRAIWEDVLAIAPIGLKENFFDVGGTSLAAMRLMNAVHERLGVDLPPSTLLVATTIAAMADVIDSEEQEDFPLVVLLKPGTVGRPVFIVHGMYADVFGLHALVLRLQTDRPVYGVRARGLDRRAQAQTTVEAMAEEFVRHIRVTQPSGPYAFAGHSFGGLVAFEMARLMKRAGEEVDSLTLIDTNVDKGCLTPIARAAFLVTRPLLKIWRGLRAPERTLGRLLRRVAPNLAPTMGIWPSERLVEALPPSLVRLGEINVAAFKRYRPASYPGRVMFIRAERRDVSFCKAVPVWTRLVEQGLVVESLACRHDEVLSEPHVQVLADRLTANLAPRTTFARSEGFEPPAF